MALPLLQASAMEWTSLGSFLATIVLFRALIQQYLPPELISGLRKLVRRLVGALRRSIIIEEQGSHGRSEAYDAAIRYLSDKFSRTAKITVFTKKAKSKGFSFTVGTSHSLEDQFEGVKVKWSFHSKENQQREECQYINLSFDAKFSDRVRDLYLPHVMDVAKELRRRQRVRKLFTNRSADGKWGLWSSVDFDHPSTFDTLALDPQIKSTLENDLTKFLKKEKYYKRVGRTWKRGYLLYGPPGTGKTSLIAAIANFLEFDIYDIELTAVSNNLLLRRLLLETKRKSVIVIEDIDCSLQFSDRNNSCKDETEEKKGTDLSLSGVLNFMDGLWSCCGEERLMVFTTNYKERLYPALLRAGRMDLHIHLSYCGVPAFRQLVKNYLEVEDHPVMKEVEALLIKVDTTPADIAEVLMGCEEDPDLALKTVLSFLMERLEKSEVESSISSEPELVDM